MRTESSARITTTHDHPATGHQVPPGETYRGRRTGETGHRTILTAAVYGVMGVMVVLTLYPIVWMLLGGFKTASEFYSNVWGLPSTFHIGNFVEAWTAGDLGLAFLNSIAVTVGTLAIALPITSTAGYALARIEFAGRGFIFILILMGLAVPFGIIAIPIFTIINQFGLLNTLPGLILAYAANVTPIGVFLMYAFFKSLPNDLAESAQVDGCSHFGAFVRVILPLAKPGLATQLIFTGTTIWNEYFMANVLIHSQDNQTIPLAIVTFTSRFETDFTTLFAALTIATIPMIILYLSLQRQFVSGMAAGALKG